MMATDLLGGGSGIDGGVDGELDYGDAPDSYRTLMASSGASHVVVPGAPQLGSLIDVEIDGQPDPNAKGDDNNGLPDEDGVTFATPLIAGGMAQVKVENGGGDGLLNAWMDFNANGSFEPVEQIFTNLPLPGGSSALLNFAVPASAAVGAQSFARFRVNSNGGIGPAGFGFEGEVEDYEVFFEGEQDERIDFGDAPDPTYPTLIASNGAAHFIRPDAPMLGATIDAEPDGQPSPGADGDDVAGIADEDGVVFTSPLVAGNMASVDVTNGGALDGLLNAWVDFDADGTWTAAEQIATDVVIPTGTTLAVPFLVPGGSAVGASTYARFRLDSGGGLTPKDFADDGEVEDYKVAIEGEQDERFDFGDAPDPTYPTLIASGGAAHLITPNGPRLGVLIDSEFDGQPSANAAGDDAAGIDDEDGVVFTTPLIAGAGASVDVTNGGANGRLNAWIDFNADGVWSPAEQIATNVPIPGGATVPVGFVIPAASPVGVPTYARFRIDSGGGLGPGGMAADGEVEDYLIRFQEPQEERFDFGDAPDPTYPTLSASGGAAHLITPNGPRLGALIDAELDGQPSANALGDDAAGIDDEDGVVFTTPLIAGGAASVDVTNGGGNGRLNAWIDFNADGVWSPAEQIATNVPIPGGATVPVGFVIPAASPVGVPTYARFRIDSGGGLGPDGVAADGEVEDYLVRFEAPQEELDWGDAPDPTYRTLAASGGAAHVITANGPRLGTLIDAEPDGQPSPFADRDDLNGVDDEDGVVFAGPLVTGAAASVDVTNGGANGRLNAWIDFDADGAWSPAEQIATNVFVPGGATITVPFSVPASTVVGGPTFARFRINTVGGLSPGGIAADGEVEDYAVKVAKAGDFDLDGDVDGADFLIWQANFPDLSGTATVTDGDANGDGNVDGADFLIWQACFPYAGPGPAPGTGSGQADGDAYAELSRETAREETTTAFKHVSQDAQLRRAAAIDLSFASFGSRKTRWR